MIDDLSIDGDTGSSIHRIIIVSSDHLRALFVEPADFARAFVNAFINDPMTQ
jgi:hypothetical protein